MTDDLPFDYVDVTPATGIAPAPRPCRRHSWLAGDTGVSCRSCGKAQNLAAVQRGKNNRKRGNAAELDVARALPGGRKVGPLGHPWDVEVPGLMRLQVKKVARWPSVAKALGYIDAIPAGRDMRGAVLIQSGRGGRRLILLDLDEFAGWYGDPTADSKGAA